MNKKQFDKLPVGTALYVNHTTIMFMIIKLSANNLLFVSPSYNFWNLTGRIVRDKLLALEVWEVAPKYIQELYNQSWVRE